MTPPKLSSIKFATSPTLLMRIGDRQAIPLIQGVWSDGSISNIDSNDCTIVSSRPDRVQVDGGYVDAIGIGSSSIRITYQGKYLILILKVIKKTKYLLGMTDKVYKNEKSFEIQEWCRPKSCKL